MTASFRLPSSTVLLLVLGFLHVYILHIQATCSNWCSHRGECIQEPGNEEYCRCDAGFAGSDCSIKICPKAFDVLTIADNNNRRAINLKMTHSGGFLGGEFGFSFAGDMVRIPVVAAKTSCASSINTMLTVSKSKCENTFYDEATGETTLRIELVEYPLYSTENNLIYHNGNPPLSYFHCNNTYMDFENAKSPTCEITDAMIRDLPEYLECGNHGTCNSVTGTCKCEKGFQGPACNDVSDKEDKHVVFHDGPFFSGNMLKVEIERKASTAFNFLKLSNKDEDVTTIRGDGQLVHNGKAFFRENVFVGHSDNKAAEVEGFNNSLWVSSINTVSDEKSYSHHWMSLTDGTPVASISAQGDLLLAGSISAGSGSFLVEDGFISASNMEVRESMDVGGALTIGESLSIGTGIVMSPSGITIDSSGTHSNSNNALRSSSRDGSDGGEASEEESSKETPKGVVANPHPALELRAQNIAFDGSIFEIHAVGSLPESSQNMASLFRTVTDGVTTFDLKANGDVSTNSLHMLSGGIEIKSNGLKVNAGGVTVAGGIDLRSGMLQMSQAELSTGSVKLSGSDGSKGGQKSGSLLSLDSGDAQFANSMIDIKVSSVSKDFTVLKVEDTNAFPLLEIKADGSLWTAGDIAARGGIFVEKESKLAGGVSLQQYRVAAADQIAVPLTSSYVVVTDNKSPSKNVLNFVNDDKEMSNQLKSLLPGKLIVVSNEDAEELIGDLSMPPRSTVIFVYDGERFQDIQVMSVPIKKLVGIKAFTAANDLDVGNVTFAAGVLASSALSSGRVPFVGGRGVLLDSDKLTFDAAAGQLAVPSIKVSRLVGSIDAKGSELKNAYFTNADISSSSISADSFRLSNSSGGLAYFDSEGLLKSSSNIAINKNGELDLKSLHANIDGRGHSLEDVSITAKTADIKEASIDRLKLPKLSSSSSGLVNFLTIDSTGDVSASSAISIDQASNTINIPTLNGFQMAGDINMNFHTISNANIEGGSINADNFNVKGGLSLESLKRPDSSSSALLTSDVTGKIIFADSPSHEIKFNNLDVRSTLRVNGDIVGNGKSLLKGFNIDISSLDFGSSTLPKLSVDSLSIPSMKMSNLDSSNIVNEFDSRIVLADKSGKLHPSDEVLIRPIIKGNKRSGESEVVMNNVNIKNSLTVNKLLFDKDSDIAIALKGSERRQELVGINPLTLEVEIVSEASLDSLRIEKGGELFLIDAKLKLGGLKSALLAVNGEGQVVDASTLSVGDNNDLSLSKLTSSYLKSEAVSARSIKSAALTFADPKLLFLNSQQGGDSALLSVDLGTGDVRASQDIAVNSIKAAASIKTNSLSVNSLRIQFPDSLSSSASAAGDASKFTSVLVASTDGSISSRTSLALDDLTVAGKVEVRGAAHVGSITVSSLSTSGGKNPVVADSRGMLEAASSLTLDALSVSGDVKLFGALAVDHIRMPAAKPGVLTVGPDGHVSSSNSLSVKEVASQSIVNSGELLTDSLRVSSLKSSTSNDITLLASDKNGLIQPMTSTALFSQISLPLPDKVEFSEIMTNKVISLGSIRLADGFPGKGQRGFLEVDASGKVKVASDELIIENLAVTSDAKFNGKLNVNALQFSKSSYQVSEGLLAMDKESREVYSVKDVQIKAGVVSALGADFKSGFINAKSASIGELAGDLDVQNHVISNARIEGSKIANSEIKLDHLVPSRLSSATGGNLLFRSSEDGLLSVSETVSIDKEGMLRLKGLAPSSSSVDSYVDITNARVQNSIIESSQLVNISSVETERVDFVGLDGSSATEVHIKGYLRVDGYIQGSCTDNSDRRLKKDIEPITNVLDKLDDMQAVSYNLRVDEFPSKLLDSQPQIGWIANDINGSFPELVSTDKDGFLAVSYSRSAALLAEAIKELKERYESRIAVLEARIVSLETQCDSK